MNLEAFFKISYGLYVVCSKYLDKSNGYIANTVFQVTAEPAKFAISCSKNNFTTELIQKSGIFSASVLNINAKSELIGAFGYKSGRDSDKISGFEIINGQSGCPILIEDCIAWFECKVVDSFDTGTHIIFIGEMIDNAMLDETAEPLTYSHYRSVRKGKAPKNAPTYIKVDDKTESEVRDVYYCPACGYVYNQEAGDPDSGIAPGTKFEDIPNNWVCPVCGVSKSDFVKK